MGRRVLISLVVLAVAAGATVMAIASRSDEAESHDVPVVIVPGFFTTEAVTVEMVTRLRDDGFEVLPVTLPALGMGAIEDSAESLAKVIDGLETRPIDLIGYSAGGVVVRYYLQELGGAEVVRRAVLVGTPHEGARVATGFANRVPRLCVGACAELRPGSQFLAELKEGRDRAAGVDFVNIYSATDQLIKPLSTADLPGALNVVLQDVCSDDHTDHGGLLVRPLAVGLVVEAVNGRLRTVPGPDDCERIREEGVLQTPLD